jgi:hypothetical protein
MSRTSIRNTIGLALVVAAVGIPGANAGTEPTWRHALDVRSTELNREYHLGRFAVPATAGTTAKPPWLKALEARSRVLNQRYSLGQYTAPRHGVDVKKWTAIGVALAAMVAALLTAVVLVRRASRRTAPRVPESA